MSPRISTPRRTRARTGFTLIESMVVVTIIGLLAAAVLPAMSDMVAGTRQQSAANDIMLLARRARREAMLGGKYAYGLVFQQDGGGGNQGGVQLVTGLTAHCNRSMNINYGTDPLTRVVLPVGFPSALGGMEISDLNFGGHRIVSRADMPQGNNVRWLHVCYAVNGETHVSTAPNVAAVMQINPAVVYVERQVAGGTRGVTREIVFPPGGTARPR